jgi:hypothetical protein
MQYSVVALAALAATASAHYNGTVVYTTEVHTAYTTVCPASTELTFNGVTYTATEATTLTITNCPCTVVKPVTTSSVVYCNTCAPTNPPVYTNATTAAPTAPTTEGSVGTTVVPTASPSSTPIEANSGNKAFALSGASLAGLLGLAAYVL